MNPLTGQRVLLIAPRFFGYDQDIATELRRRGAEVDFLPDRPFDTPLMKAVTRFGRQLILKAADKFYQRAFERLGRASYDLIFVVNGQTLSTFILTELRSSFPNARFVLYIWDSFRNRRSIIDNLHFFDDCLSFDPDCSKAYGLRFRPRFFSPGFAHGHTDEFDYHLSFIGTAHTDRYTIISSVAQSLEPHIRCYWYLYIQAPWVFYVYRLSNPAFRTAKIASFHFEPLQRVDVQKVFFRSRAILDIEHPLQTGLTIRTLETLGASRKLITTNGRVREYDFFRDENIYVIDRRRAKVPKSFLETPYCVVDPLLYEKYSLKGWMDEVLGNESVPLRDRTAYR